METTGASGEDLRATLVEQLRSAGRVRSERVAAAFAAVPRELFLPGHVRRHGLAAAYRDEAVVTRQAQDGSPSSSSSQPSIMAEMLEMLALRPGAASWRSARAPATTPPSWRTWSGRVGR